MTTVETDIPLTELEEITRDNPETFPNLLGQLQARNGAATMKYDGPFEVYPTYRGWKRDPHVILEVSNGRLTGDMAMTPTDAARLGAQLLALSDELGVEVDND